MTARENMGAVLEKSGAYRLTGSSPLEWELAAYGAGFRLVEDGLQRAWDGIFAATAGEGRLAQWESRFLPGPFSALVDVRREISGARLCAWPEPPTLADVPRLMLAAGIRGSAEMDGGVLRMQAGEFLLPEAIARKELARLLPLHWQWELAGV